MDQDLWREVDEKEFAEFLNILGLSPTSGSSYRGVTVTRFGKPDELPLAEMVVGGSGKKTYWIAQSLP